MSSGESEERSDRVEDIDCRAVRAWMFGLRKLGKITDRCWKDDNFECSHCGVKRKKTQTGEIMNCDAQKMAEQIVEFANFA